MTAGHGKFRFNLVIMDGTNAELAEEWKRQIVDAIGAIPGVQIEGATAIDSTVAGLLAPETGLQMRPMDGETVLARMTKAIEDVDQRLRAIEGNLRGMTSAKESERPSG